MTPAAFRRIAMSMFAAVESSHMGHPDFRVNGKIFASLPPARKEQPDESIGMVKLTPAEQGRFVKKLPKAFVAAQGAWGRQGCTYVRLANVDTAALRPAMTAAWSNAAPKGLRDEFGPKRRK
jgi:hypothetical protein